MILIFINKVQINKKVLVIFSLLCSYMMTYFLTVLYMYVHHETSQFTVHLGDGNG